MGKTPHKEKLLAAMRNPKCTADTDILSEAYQAYEHWIAQMNGLTSTGREKVREMTGLLNEYKDLLEVELIARRGSAFIKRQKGQLKIDNSVLEEFFIHLVDPSILQGLPDFELEVGPQTAFMSLSFIPRGVSELGGQPNVVVKHKDQDFGIGKTIHYMFSADETFSPEKTAAGEFLFGRARCRNKGELR